MSSKPSEQSSTPTDNLAAWLSAATLAIGTGWAVYRPFRSHAFWMNFAQDDFFYYLKIAENVATGHGSTFNGLLPTNGYHPLWMLVLAAVIRLGAGAHGIFIFLAVSIWCATMATFWLSLRLLARSGLHAVMSALCAAFIAVYCMHLYAECMEVTLAVPLMLAVMGAVQATGWWSASGRAGWWRALCVGLLVSLMILSRLDSAIFAGLLVLTLLAQRSLRSAVRLLQVSGFLTGTLPVLAYLLSNRLWFGVWMPISGMAKELKLDHGFTAKAVDTLLELSGTQKLNLVGITAVLLLLPLFWRWLRPIEKVLAVAALSFPFVYVAALSWISDWRLWGWYFYSLRPALCIALLVLFRVPKIAWLAQSRMVLTAFALLTVFRITRLRWDEQGSPMMVAAVEIQQFAETHPGVYAMGDRSGSVGYLLPDPLVQTEGLVMDRQFLKTIAAQTPLRAALAPYHVRYYIASVMQPYTGCFHAVEPWQAGPHAPHMRGIFCEPPAAHWKHDTVETAIFDLSQH